MDDDLTVSSSSEMTAAQSLRSLKVAYHQWWGFLQVNGRWQRDPSAEECSRVAAARRVFTDDAPANSDAVRSFVTALAKGKELIESALLWEGAVVGGRGSETDSHRGAQWRLVIAWSGLENIVTAAGNYRNLWRSSIERFVGCCNLPNYVPLTPPHRQLANLERWLARGESDGALEAAQPNSQADAVDRSAKRKDKSLEARDDGHTDIHRFLGLTGQDVVGVIRHWLVDGRPVESWVDAMVLAKAFRHVSAHGALSATKVTQWGLRPAFDRLLPEIGLLAAAALNRLVGAGVSQATQSARGDAGRLS